MLWKTKSYSLTNRVLVTSLIILPILLLAGSALLYQAFKSSLENALQHRMQSQIYTLLSDAEFEAQTLWMPEQTSEPSFSQVSSGQLAWVRDQKQVVWQSPSSALIQQHLLDSEVPIVPGKASFYAPSTHNPYFKLSQDIRWQTEDGESLLRFVVAHEPEALYSELDAFSRQITIGVSGLTFLLLLIQFVVIRWGLKPLDKMAEDLARLESGEIRQLEGSYPRELTKVINNLNQVLAAQRSQRERFKNTLADLAHSLKTPLAIMKSQASQAQTNMVDEQVTRMDNIISHQLNRAHLGYQPLAEQIPAKPLISRITNALSKLDAYADINTQLNIADHIRVNADEGDLMEILGNLIENAYKYGHSKVEISAQEDHQNFEVKVEDDGPGIAPQLQTAILKRGARSDTASLGQGLGLAVVTDILSSYKGELSISSSTLGGASLTFTLPKLANESGKRQI